MQFPFHTSYKGPNYISILFLRPWLCSHSNSSPRFQVSSNSTTLNDRARPNLFIPPPLGWRKPSHHISDGVPRPHHGGEDEKRDKRLGNEREQKIHTDGQRQTQTQVNMPSHISARTHLTGKGAQGVLLRFLRECMKMRVTRTCAPPS